MTTLEQLRTGQLAGTRRLKLACGLREFPREIFTLADTLEILDLSGNELSSLPDDLPRLHRLRILFCSDNRFTELPAVLGRCPQLSMVGFKANRIRRLPVAALPPALRWLILTDNQLAALPPEIGRCAGLQKLMLAGNRLSSLPPELAACTRLELLRIAANRLEELPAWLFSLPRLSWLAYAGNPFCAAAEDELAGAAQVPGIAWAGIDLGIRLGEGASGVIHRAAWSSGEEGRDVAVKLFKGAVTSDGLPHCEMLACLGAGKHSSLIPVLGRVEGHPDGAEGLVMELVDPALRNLAGPPSLDSCTRDVYAGDAVFTVATAVRIALAIAAAARHLHARGIMHGDLYAHNILHAGDGRALLGDFGAASLVPAAHAEALQGVEVRAFSCLLEELVERCLPSPADDGALRALARLQAACAGSEARTRPLFADIEAKLRNLLAQHTPLAAAV